MGCEYNSEFFGKLDAFRGPYSQRTDFKNCYVNSTCVWKQRSIYTRNEAEPLPRGTKPNGFLFRL